MSDRFPGVRGPVTALCCAAVAGVQVVGCNQLAGIGEPQDRCVSTTDFGPAVLVEGINSLSSNDEGARLAPDELTVYFHSDRGGTKDLYAATRSRRTDAFGAPELLGVSTTAEESWPTVTADGLNLFFEVGDGWISQVYVSTRSGLAGAFTERAWVVLGMYQRSGQPFILPDGESIVYSLQGETWNLYRSDRIYHPHFNAPAPISTVNSDFDDFSPVASADDLILYFASGRGEGDARGGNDIWVARRPSRAATYDKPTNVQPLNTSADEVPSWLSPDGCRLYFHSFAAGTSRIYVAEKLR